MRANATFACIRNVFRVIRVGCCTMDGWLAGWVTPQPFFLLKKIKLNCILLYVVAAIVVVAVIVLKFCLFALNLFYSFN